MKHGEVQSPKEREANASTDYDVMLFTDVAHVIAMLK